MLNFLKKFWNDKMNKILFILFFVLILVKGCDVLHAKEDNNIYIYQNKKVVGYFTKEEFASLINNSDLYVSEIEAEKEDRVEIKVLDSPYKIEKENKYKARFTITWKDSKGKVLKEITLDSIITINENASNPYPSWCVLYRNITEYSTPVLIILCVILAII